MSDDLYAIAVFITAIFSLNIGIYYLIRALKNKSSIFLSLGIILCAICLVFTVYEIKGYFIQYPQFLWLNGPLLFMIGPMFFLHVKIHVKKIDYLHFIIAIIMFFWVLPFYIKSADEKLVIIRETYSTIGDAGIQVMQYLYLLHIGIYTFIGYLYLKNKNSELEDYSSNSKIVFSNRSSMNLYLYISLISTISFALCVLLNYLNLYFNVYDKYTISLLVVFIIILQFYISFKGYDEFIIDENVSDRKIDASKKEDYLELVNKLEKLMLEEELYKDPDLKILDVANKLDVSMHQLSASINYYYKNNFFDYINKLRLSEVKKNLLDTKNKNLTFFAIANQSGFNSNSSFYRIFKKYEDMTPKQYVDKNQNR